MRLFKFITIIIALFLLGAYFKDSIEKGLSAAHLSLPPEVLSTITALVENANQLWVRVTASASKTAQEEVSSSTPSQASSAPLGKPLSNHPPILELTKVPLTGESESLTTLDGEHYTGVIKRVEPDGIVLRTSDGVTKLKFKNLPPEVGTKYGYNPELEVQFLRFRNQEDIIAQQNAEKLYAPPVTASSKDLPSAISTPVEVKPPLIAQQTDSLVQNGDFSRGKNGWSGDGDSIADYLRVNPQSFSTNLPANGLIIALRPHDWTILFQKIRGDNNPNYILTMKYVLSPGISLSTLPADYMDIIGHTHISEWEGFSPINLSPGQFFDTIKDTSDNKGFYEKYSPNLSSSEDQTYEHHVPPLPPGSSKLVAVAFPPGKGYVLIKSISVTSH
jgi:hypothetical protein